MQKARTALTLLLVAACAAAAATTATAAAPSPTSPAGILDSCEHHDGQLTRHYTAAQLRAAYHAIPTVDTSYDVCASVIFSQLQSEQNGSVGDSGGSGSGFPWIIVIIVVIVVIGGGGAGWAYWRNRQTGPPSSEA